VLPSGGFSALAGSWLSREICSFSLTGR
jgi:hypothetical protein